MGEPCAWQRRPKFWPDNRSMPLHLTSDDSVGALAPTGSSLNDETNKSAVLISRNLQKCDLLGIAAMAFRSVSDKLNKYFQTLISDTGNLLGDRNGIALSLAQERKLCRLNDLNRRYFGSDGKFRGFAPDRIWNTVIEKNDRENWKGELSELPELWAKVRGYSGEWFKWYEQPRLTPRNLYGHNVHSIV